MSRSNDPRYSSGDGWKLDSVWWALRIGLGAAAFLVGLDKFFYILADWTAYMSPLAVRMLPVSPAAFMRAVGVIEMAVGLAILTRWTRLGAYVAMVWLALIAANLVSTGRYFDVAVRDAEMAIAAFALARLTEVRQAAAAPAALPAGGSPAPRTTGPVAAPAPAAAEDRSKARRPEAA